MITSTYELIKSAHKSDCATNNEPATKAGLCNCERIDAIWEAVERQLDIENHDELCACVSIPCVTYGDRKPWSYSAHRAVEIVATVLLREDGMP